MYKDRFVPLHHLHDIRVLEEDRREEEQIRETPCREEELMAEKERLQEQINSMSLLIEGLQEENKRLLEECRALKKELEEKVQQEKLMQNLSTALAEAIRGTKLDLQQELLVLVKKILYLLFDSDVLKEDLLEKLLLKVVQSGVELRGKIDLYLSPEDYERFSVESLAKYLSGEVEVSVRVREDLRRGEFLIETPKLWIERRYENLLQDILEELKDEGLQSLS